MACTSPTQRSLKYLRDRGYTAQVVEHWNPFARRRIDLFGVLDVVAIRGDAYGVLGVQTTSGSNLAARRTKALDSDQLYIWLSSGNRFHLHGWSKRGAKGKRKLWTCRVVEVTLDDFAASDEAPHVEVEVG